MHIINIVSKELYRLKIDNTNNDMFIVDVIHTEQMFWYDIFNEVVKERIIYCYSTNDNVLKKLLEPCVKKKPIG